MTSPALSSADEVVDICRDLIRIDTTNTGDTQTSAGERVAAEYVAEMLAEVGVEAELRESAPGRASLVARIPGTDSSRGALLVHGHLDVVPADPGEWSVDPFGGEIRDGYLWGRGAVDMKDFDAMVLAVIRDWQRRGVRPPRDLVPLPRRQPRRPAGGLHRGDRRGRRLLLHGLRRPAALPDRDRRKGHPVAQAHRERAPWPRLDDPR
jgi:acetylornithine deacetylase/succinyl-diaminopimelate desuccinylase-like protein